MPAINANVSLGVTNSSGWFPAGNPLFSPIMFTDAAQGSVPSTCYFSADVAGDGAGAPVYKANTVLDPTLPLLLPVGKGQLTFQAYCNATDINGAVSEKLVFTVTLKVGAELGPGWMDPVGAAFCCSSL